MLKFAWIFKRKIYSQLLNIYSPHFNRIFYFWICLWQKWERKGREKRHSCQIHVVHNQSDINVCPPFQKGFSVWTSSHSILKRTTRTQRCFSNTLSFTQRNDLQTGDPSSRSLFCMKLSVTGKCLCVRVVLFVFHNPCIYTFFFHLTAGSSTGNNLASLHIGACTWAIEGVVCDMVCWRRPQACWMNACACAEQQHQLARYPLSLFDRGRRWLCFRDNLTCIGFGYSFQKLLFDLSLHSLFFFCLDNMRTY